MRQYRLIAISTLLSMMLAACGQNLANTPLPPEESGEEWNQAAPDVTVQEVYAGTRQTPINVYYDPTISSYGYTGAFDSARADWANRSSVVGSLIKLSTKGATTDIYKAFSDANGVAYGETYHYAGGVIVNDGDNWDYSSVRINDYFIQHPQNTNTPQQQSQRTTRHEMGHTFKLDHTSQPAIMNINAGSNYLTVQPFDISELKRKWGN